MFRHCKAPRTDKPTTDDCIILRLPKLKGLGMLKRGHTSRRDLSYPYGTLTVVSDIECFEPRPCLKIVGQGFGRQIDQTIELESMPMRFGGERWFAKCPLSEKRCTTLVLPNGEARFASVAGWGVSYVSQRLGPVGRKFLALEKADRRLRGLSKYTRMPTRQRLKEEIRQLTCELEHEICNNEC